MGQTRPGPDPCENPWFSWQMNVNMLESAAWLPTTAGALDTRAVRSLVLPDLRAAGPCPPCRLVAQGQLGLLRTE